MEEQEKISFDQIKNLLIEFGMKPKSETKYLLEEVADLLNLFYDKFPMVRGDEAKAINHFLLNCFDPTGDGQHWEVGFESWEELKEDW